MAAGAMAAVEDMVVAVAFMVGEAEAASTAVAVEAFAVVTVAAPAVDTGAATAAGTVAAIGAGTAVVTAAGDMDADGAVGGMASD